ncbi:hypothetical protein AC578_7274 [Pseudocercospora eumusae]|uniref:Uncharacterized protein n=1 Tax=Pseudocercospora eumusae TaxID=321146 RepID=A0A139HWP3_9PEZI|nr:hypothetical protein AC578_7274 [Pseudocercospora eumusae]
MTFELSSQPSHELCNWSNRASFVGQRRGIMATLSNDAMGRTSSIPRLEPGQVGSTPWPAWRVVGSRPGVLTEAGVASQAGRIEGKVARHLSWYWTGEILVPKACLMSLMMRREDVCRW